MSDETHLVKVDFLGRSLMAIISCRDIKTLMTMRTTPMGV